MNSNGEERLKPMNKNRQAGKGLFKPVTLSAPLAKVTGRISRGLLTHTKALSQEAGKEGFFAGMFVCSATSANLLARD